MILTAPAAYAQTEQQIKSDCEADGGTYASHVANGNTVSQCCYRTNQGLATTHHLQCFYYLNGIYDGQGIYDEQPPGTTQPPTQMTPAPGAIPPGAPAGSKPGTIVISRLSDRQIGGHQPSAADVARVRIAVA